MGAKASARKSLGEYKPLIVYPSGSTEVCEKSPERQDRYTKHGVIKGNKKARGTTYPTKEEAVAAAQRVIDLRLEDAYARKAKFEMFGRPTEKIQAEIDLWSGK